MQPFSRQEVGKHVPAAANTHATIVTVRNGVFYSVLAKSYKKNSGGGVEYLHRHPASRRRRRKKKSRIWDSKIWSRASWDSDPRMTALTRAVLSSERAPTSRNLQLSNSNKNLVVSPRRVLYSKIDWPLTVGRYIRLNSTQSVELCEGGCEEMAL
jgi:hypothetical protein